MVILLGALPAPVAPVDLVSRIVSGQDLYGNDIRTETRTSSPGWVLWPSGLGAEQVQGQDIISDALTGLAPMGTLLTAVDRVEVFGKSYEVKGTPYVWVSPFTGTTLGVQVQLEAVSG